MWGKGEFLTFNNWICALKLNQKCYSGYRFCTPIIFKNPFKSHFKKYTVNLSISPSIYLHF